MEKISKNVSYKEATRSITAIRLGLENKPNDYELTNMNILSEMFEYIKDNLDFDQMIWEFGDDENPDWVHVSYVSEDGNRKRCLKAYRENGKTKYKVI